MLLRVLLPCLFAEASSQLFLATAAEATVQHIYIVRHGDKYSSYPPCPVSTGGSCFDEALYGDNPPLTPCGERQARYVAQILTNTGIQHVVASPFTRTLQTALPIVEALNLTHMKVDNFLSEARQDEGPFRPFNALLNKNLQDELIQVSQLWDHGYGSPPIRTPENDALYMARVRRAGESLRSRFPPSSGNVAMVTHATPAFSIAYGLCYGSDGSDFMLQQFVEGQDPIGPTGIIHIVRDSNGHCISIGQTDNQYADSIDCGATTKYKCNFTDYPDWYWEHASGKGPGLCS